eukprot:1183326-Prorocentrum_minimum.AAC.1
MLSFPPVIGSHIRNILSSPPVIGSRRFAAGRLAVRGPGAQARTATARDPTLPNWGESMMWTLRLFSVSTLTGELMATGLTV